MSNESLSNDYSLFSLTGFPIALSYPHFYKSDPSLLAKVEGLEPKQDKHESYFFIQPKSGLPVDLAFRFQINMALQDISSIANVDGFSDLVLPLLWFEIVSTINILQYRINKINFNLKQTII